MTSSHTLLNGRVTLVQPETGYRAGMDAVMLAAACPAQPGQTVLELGCGAGAASLCLMARVPGLTVTGIEIQPAMVELARRNATLNNITDWHIITGDFQDRALAVPGNHFDHVIMNPPYLTDGQAAPPDAARRTAFVETAPLAVWLGVAGKKLKQGGMLTLIHRADRMADILQQMDGFGAFEIIPLWPKPDSAANRIIIRARKDRKTPAILHPGIRLFNAADIATPIANSILRDGHAIP